MAWEARASCHLPEPSIVPSPRAQHRASSLSPPPFPIYISWNKMHGRKEGGSAEGSGRGRTSVFTLYCVFLKDGIMAHPVGQWFTRVSLVPFKQVPVGFSGLLVCVPLHLLADLRRQKWRPSVTDQKEGVGAEGNQGSWGEGRQAAWPPLFYFLSPQTPPVHPCHHVQSTFSRAATRSPSPSFWWSMECSTPSWSWSWRPRGGEGLRERQAPGHRCWQHPLDPKCTPRGLCSDLYCTPLLTSQGANVLSLWLPGPAHKSRFQCRARLAFPPDARGLLAHHHGCCPLSWKAWARRDPWT